MKLSPPLRIAEVAALLGWSSKRTKRWLLVAHRASSGTLLEGGGDCPYTVTLSALRRAYPDVFEPPPGLEGRLEELESKQLEDERQRLQMATVLGVLRRQGTKPKATLRAA